MSDNWWSSARQDPAAIPFRNKFDAARDPLTARNAIGAVDAKYVTDAIAAAGGGGGAPTTAEYITSSPDATLSAERVLTNTATVTWDFSVAGQAKATAIVAGGGNVSNSGTPTVGQYAKWVTATTIQGVAPATVLSDIGAQPAGSYLTTAVAAATYQPLDADLTAIAALTGTNTIYYRSAANTWTAVTIGANLTFTGGTLAATSGGGSSAVTQQVFTSGSGTYTKPGGVTRIEVIAIGGGSGGAGGGGSNLGTAGSNTTFGSITAGGGVASAVWGHGGAGGTTSGGTVNISGGGGGAGSASLAGTFGGNGGTGGNSAFGGGAQSIYSNALNGAAGAANSGGGGAGGGCSSGTTSVSGGGGGAGGFAFARIAAPSATYSYAVGGGGAGGTGISAANGGAGGSGIIIVSEYY